MGYCGECQFVKLLRRPDSVAIIWSQQYTKVQGDCVAKMVMITEDDQYRVDHVFVF